MPRAEKTQGPRVIRGHKVLPVPKERKGSKASRALKVKLARRDRRVLKGLRVKRAPKGTRAILRPPTSVLSKLMVR